MSRATFPGRPSRLVAAAGVVLVLLGTGSWLAREGDPGPRAGAAGRTAGGGTASAPGVAPDVPAATPARRTAGAPRGITIPDLGVDAPVVPIRTAGGTLVPPADPGTLGWWADGARPGDRRGSALLTGHTVHTGGGALDDLERLTRGDRITVRGAAATTTYAVVSVRIYGKGVLARRAEELFDQRVAGRLVLVTCEDWDGQEYLSNVVVTAAPVVE